MRKILFLIGLLVAIWLCFYCLSNHGKEIQADITNRLAATMSGEDSGSLSVSPSVATDVNGRDVTLSGVVATQAEKDLAEARAKDLRGVRVVHNNITVAFDEPEAITYVEPEFEVEPVFEPEPPVVEAPVIEVAEQKNEACEQNFAAIVEREKINFSSGKALIKPQSLPVLDLIVAEAAKCKDSILHIHGHSDNTGAASFNKSLSLKRAKSVGLYLLNKGVMQEIRVHGHGPDLPVASNATAEGRAKNRRIEFKVMKIED